jgi:hypothetical protein
MEDHPRRPGYRQRGRKQETKFHGATGLFSTIRDIEMGVLGTRDSRVCFIRSFAVGMVAAATTV